MGAREGRGAAVMVVMVAWGACVNDGVQGCVTSSERSLASVLVMRVENLELDAEDMSSATDRPC